MQNITNFTEGKILGPLLRFAFPVLCATFLQTMYGAVDLIVVGQCCTEVSCSAVSSGGYLMQTITMLVTDLSMGLTILLGQKLGEKKEKECGFVIGEGLILFTVIAFIIAVLMQFLAPLCTAALKVPSEAVNECNAYIRICCGGAFFIVAYNVLGSIFRGLGNSRVPLIIVAIACVVNIALDLLFVAVFKMKSAGAALATIIAQGVSVLISMFFIKNMKMPFTFSKKSIVHNRNYTIGILKLGSPIALQNLLVGFSFLVITSIVNSMGLIASSGIGIAERVCGFIMLVPIAFGSSMSAFVSQNVGARKYDRTRKALLCGIGCSVTAGIFLSYLGFFHGDLLCKAFKSDNREVVMAGWEYLKGYAIDTLFTSFLFCFVGYFNGYGKTTFVMIQGIIGALGIRVPLSFVIHHFWPKSIFYLALANPASTIVQIILCGIAFIVIKKETDKYQSLEQTK